METSMNIENPTIAESILCDAYDDYTSEPNPMNFGEFTYEFIKSYQGYILTNKRYNSVEYHFKDKSMIAFNLTNWVYYIK